MTTMREQILEALQRAPKGLTSRQLAEIIGMPLSNISSCASRMCSYGKIERESVRERRIIESEAILWRTKERPDGKS